MPTSRKRKPAAKGQTAQQAKPSYRAAVVVLLVAAAVAGAIVLWPRERGTVEVRVPELSRPAQRGAQQFAANCASCHGENAAGGPGGPPLVHKIYEPGHHADGSIYLAVQRGVRQHHWTFGNMPPVAGLNDREVAFIIAYVRELQRANGIN